MTSNEEMAEKLAEKFYGLIEGDVSVSGGELAKLFVMALDQAGLALSEKAKAYISFEPVLPNGKTLADMFASSDRKPLGTVIDDEDDEEEECFVTTCPECEEEVYFDETVLEDGEVVCPNCGAKLEFDLSDLAAAAEDGEDEE